MGVQTTYNQEPAIGFEGMLADTSPSTIDTGVNVEETASIPFGVAVCFAGGANEKGVKLPSTADDIDVVWGIALHSQAYGRSDLDTDGIKPEATLNILRKGRVKVKCENGCNPGDRLFIRAVATGSERLGALRSAADASDCIDSTNQGVWMTKASADGIAWLEVDFTNAMSTASP
jgi:hypothetical protein